MKMKTFIGNPEGTHLHQNIQNVSDTVKMILLRQPIPLDKITISQAEFYHIFGKINFIIDGDKKIVIPVNNYGTGE